MTCHTWHHLFVRSHMSVWFQLNYGEKMKEVDEGKSWGSHGGFEDNSLSVWIKTDNQNKRIVAVMKSMITIMKYEQATSFLPNLVFLVMQFSAFRNRYLPLLCKGTFVFMQNNLFFNTCFSVPFVPTSLVLLVSLGNFICCFFY